MPDNHKYDSLEQFFRKKTGDYEIQYKEEDWLKMEKKLQASAQQTFQRKKLYWIAAASLLILSLFSYLVIEQQISLNSFTQLFKHESETVPGLIEEFPGEITIPEEGPLSPAEIPGERGVDGDPDRADRFSAIPTDDIPGAETDLFNIPDPGSDGLAYKHETPENLAVEPGDGFIGIEYINTRDYQRFDSVLPCAGCSLERLAAIQQTESVLFKKPETEEETGEVSESYPDDLYGKSSFSTADDARSISRLSLGIIAGPDISTTGSIANFTNPGYNLGITAEYKINQNLSISTGIVQSKVRYQAIGDEYTPSDYYFNQGIHPSETNAVCLILDVPVTLSYRFLHFENSRLYASAGLSSYIMLNEEYQFHYNIDNPGQTESWNDRTGARHLISNANLSLGYEVDLLPSWSLRAEPYLKIPVNEIGWGNVKLYSFGSLISLNFKL